MSQSSVHATATPRSSFLAPWALGSATCLLPCYRSPMRPQGPLHCHRQQSLSLTPSALGRTSWLLPCHRSPGQGQGFSALSPEPPSRAHSARVKEKGKKEGKGSGERGVSTLVLRVNISARVSLSCTSSP